MMTDVATLEPAGDNNGRSFLRHALTVLARRRLAAGLTVALCVATGVAFSALQHERYEATAQVLLNRQNLANALTNTPDPAGQANDFARIVQTQARLARSPDLVRRVLADVGAAVSQREFLASSSVGALQSTDILIFRVSNEDPRRAARLVDAYARLFVAYRRQLDTSSLERARQQLHLRLEQVRAESDRGNADLIAQLTTKEQELRTLEALQTSNATVISGASEAQQVAPRPKRYLGLAFLFGLLLAGVVVSILDALDSRIRGSHEIETELGLPLLAHIPPPVDSDAGRVLHSTGAEALMVLRTNLEFALLDESYKLVMITSSLEREGKSTTVSSLAATMARVGKRVLLIDLDLRRPTINQFFDLPITPGVTDVALGRTSLKNAVTPVAVAGSADAGDDTRGSLHVLTAGSVPHDPGAFVTRKSLHNVLEEARALADVVLIDAPPLLPVSDAAVLAAHVDAVIVVTRLPLLRRATLQALQKGLASLRATPLGIVVTGAATESGYGYGYGYGYGSVPASSGDIRTG